MTARRGGQVGAVLLGVLAVMAVLGPVLTPAHPRPGVPFARPSTAHLLGTNDIGQDLLAEVLAGARVSLVVGLLAAVVATIVGTVVGLLAGYRRGWVDVVTMRVTDVVLCLPELPTAILIGAVLGGGVRTEVLVIALVTWAPAARELRSQTLSLRERDDIQGVRAMGGGSGYVLTHHLARELVNLVAPRFVLIAKIAILLEATLSFLGLGDARLRSWGATLSFAQARSAFLTDAWLWWVLPPGLCIVAAVLGFALVGHWVEERGRPRLGRAASRAPEGGHASEAEPTAPSGVLVIERLTVVHETPAGPAVAVDGVTVRAERGEVLGVVGESGSGKTTMMLAATGLLREPARQVDGHVWLAGQHLDPAKPQAARALRAARVGWVPQDAIEALNPVRRVGAQVADVLPGGPHPRDLGDERSRVACLLESVGLDPSCASSYPHELSGGMRQRVVLAMAVARGPDLIVADEPTSGLDVIGQAELLRVLADLRRRLGLTLVVVSHDIDMVLGLADRVLVLQRGRVVEQRATHDLVDAAEHPCTRALLSARRRLEVVP